MIPTILAAALIWLPPETFIQWSKVDGALRSHPELRLTIALTPQMATPLAKAALAPWAALGRVEIAARLHGDPVLPLVDSNPAAPRPDDALERVADARAAVEKRLGTPVSGFAPGSGALDPSLIDPLGASGAGWVVVGPYDVSGGSWAAQGRTVFLPARTLPRDATPSADALAAPGVLVVDESASEETLLLPVLATLSRAAPKSGWALASELAKAASEPRADAEKIAAWPGWDGAAPEPSADPTARAALNAYAEAAKTLSRYRDSGAADMKVLEGANALLRKTQQAKFFRAPAPGAAAGFPPELRAGLLAVYKRLKATAPDALYDVGSSTAAQTSADLPTGVHSASGPSWVGFDNPLASAARAPFGAPNADPWRLRGLRVEYDDSRVLFHVYPARVDAAPAAPRPVYDIYIDLNHLVGAGAIRLFDGRGAFAQARDAWEFALSVVGNDARLWRAGADGDPEELTVLQVESDPAKAEIRVSVPRSFLRGNPAHWGYILLSLAEDPARPGRAPAAALVGADGAQTLGLLAPVDVQKTVLDHPGTPQRVPAVRVEAGPRP
jgi:hypothetical protein